MITDIRRIKWRNDRLVRCLVTMVNYLWAPVKGYIDVIQNGTRNWNVLWNRQPYSAVPVILAHRWRFVEYAHTYLSRHSHHRKTSVWRIVPRKFLAEWEQNITPIPCIAQLTLHAFNIAKYATIPYKLIINESINFVFYYIVFICKLSICDNVSVVPTNKGTVVC